MQRSHSSVSLSEGIESLASESDGFRVDVDWRGESAYYVEPIRKVWLILSRLHGDKAMVDHMYAIWEYTDGRREELTEIERIDVLQRTIRFVRERTNVTLIAA